MLRSADAGNTERMTGILNETDAVARGDFAERGHVAKLPAKMYGSAAATCWPLSAAVVIAASNVSGVISPVSGSTSAKITSAPAIRATLAVDRKVTAGTMT